MVCLFTAAQPGPDWALMDGESVRDGESERERKREREREMSGDELVSRLQLKSIKAATLRFLSLSVLLPFSPLSILQFLTTDDKLSLNKIFVTVKKSNLMWQSQYTDTLLHNHQAGWV